MFPWSRRKNAALTAWSVVFSLVNQRTTTELEGKIAFASPAASRHACLVTATIYSRSPLQTGRRILVDRAKTSLLLLPKPLNDGHSHALKQR